jgi:hypothetical protein
VAGNTSGISDFQKYFAPDLGKIIIISSQIDFLLCSSLFGGAGPYGKKCTVQLVAILGFV